MKPENKQILDKIDVLTTQELESTGSGVISGLTVTAQSTPDMTVNVASGIVHMPNGTRLTPTGNSALTITTADTTNPRIDIIYVNTDNTIGCTEGTPLSSPIAPDTPSGVFLLAQINVEANVTSIIDSYIIDERIIKTSLVLHETDIMPHQSGLNSYASVVDSNGIYTVVDYKRADNTLYMKSTLSGGTSPNYTTDTWQFYDTDGATLLATKIWTITYDVNGKITSKVVA